MTYAPLGPKRPKKKPKPKQVDCSGGYVFIDGNAELEEGVEIYVCTNEEESDFALLETGAYETINGILFNVTDGVLISFG